MATDKPVTRSQQVSVNILMALLVAGIAAWALADWQRHEGWRWIPLACIGVIGYFTLLVILWAESLEADKDSTKDDTDKEPVTPILHASIMLGVCVVWPLVAAAYFAESVHKILNEADSHYKINQLLVFFGVSLAVFWTLYGWSKAGSPPLVRDLVILCYLVGLALFPAIMALDVGKSMRWPMMVLGIMMAGFGWPIVVPVIFIATLYEKWSGRSKMVSEPAAAERTESSELITAP